jgi:glycosyltransferase involved in cell wall biosynthesis
MSSPRDRPLRAVLLLAEFPRDASLVGALAARSDLTVYGHDRRLRGQTDPAMPPPRGCRSRVLRPLVLTPRGPLVWAYPGLGRALTQDRPSVIHVVSEPWRPIVVHAAAWARRRPGTALVVHAADRSWFRVPAAERMLRRPLAGFSLARADGFAGESRRTIGEAWAAGLSDRVPTAVLNSNPRDAELYRPARDEDERRGARGRLGLPLGGLGVGFIGRLTPEKGPLLFLDALARVPGARAWAAMAGDGPLADEARRRADGRVRLLGALRHPEAVADFYRSVDVLVVPSRRVDRWEEQGSRALMEGLLAGCVVVATAVGSNAEMLNGTGVIAREDPDALSAAIEEALVEARDPDVRVLARAHGLSAYSSGAAAAAWVKLWQRAIDHRREAGRRR